MSAFEKTVKTAASLATLLLAGAALPARADGEAESDAPHRVRKFHVECAGGDCSRHMAMFLGDDGRALELDAEDLTWVAGSGQGFAFRTPHDGGPYLGVQLTDLTRELRAHFGVPEDAGVMVSKVFDDTPAAHAGLTVGDIVTRFDGAAVASSAELWHAVRGASPGESVTLEIWRDGTVEMLTAAPEERPAQPHALRWMRFRCDEGEDDCGAASWVFSPDFGCDGCDVRIQCDGGECACTIDGETVDCDELEGGRR